MHFDAEDDAVCSALIDFWWTGFSNASALQKAELDLSYPKGRAACEAGEALPPKTWFKAFNTAP